MPASVPDCELHEAPALHAAPEPRSPSRVEVALAVSVAILGALLLGASTGGGAPAPPSAAAAPAAFAGTPLPLLLPAPEPDASDEAAIVAILEDQYAALLAMDAERYAAHLHPDAVWENALGDRYEGRDAILDFNTRVAATMEGAHYEGWAATVRFVTGEVAVADVQATLVGQHVGGRRLVDRPMLNVYVLRKDGDAWSVAHTRIRDRWTLAYAEP